VPTEVNTFNLLDEDVLANPYPHYARLRDLGPVVYSPEDDIWFVSHFNEVQEAIRLPAFYSSKAVSALTVGAISARTGPRPDVRDLNARMDTNVVAADPPEHTRLRRLVSKPFVPRAIAESGDQIRQICSDALDVLLDKNRTRSADLIRDFAFPVPIALISELLAIPVERKDDFKRWTISLTGRLDGKSLTREQRADIEELNVYFATLIKERTETPGEDLISWIIVGSETGDQPLTVEELVAFCTILLVAGNETTTNLIGNLYSALWEFPDQYQKMLVASDLSPTVEETLRYDPPLQAIPRLTNEDVELGGVEIPRDAIVLLLFGAANRDASRWSNAELFDMDRPPLGHFGFGSGIHLCLGAPLARLEMAIALEMLRERAPDIKPAGPFERANSAVLRGYASMPVTIG
jgi:cytochrome P450